MARQAPTQCHEPFLVQMWMYSPGGLREKDLGHTLSAGIAAWQVLLQPAGGAACCAAELQGARMGVRPRLLGGISLGL